MVAKRQRALRPFVLACAALWTLAGFSYGSPAPPLAPGAEAQSRVRARVEPSEPSVGGAFSIVIDVDAEPGAEVVIEPPDLDFAQLVGTSRSTQIQVVNGRVSSLVTVDFQYRALALAEGEFEVAPQRVRIDGDTEFTPPVIVRVADAPGPSPRTSLPRDDEESGRDDIFLEATVDKRTIFENEPVVLEHLLLFRPTVTQYNLDQTPTAPGFWSEVLAQPSSPTIRETERNRQLFRSAVIRRTALFPTGPGIKTIEPLEVTVTAEIRSQRRSLFSIDDFLLGGRRRVEVPVASNSVQVEVIPLPLDGRPPSFQGHVGTLAISSSVDRRQLSQHEALTYRVELEGTGNLKALKAPNLDFPAEIEAAPPRVEDAFSTGEYTVSGTRVFEYVLLPRAAGELTLPGPQVGYFDPVREEYRVARGSDIVLSVASVAGGDAAGASAPAEVESIRRSIRYIQTSPGALKPVDQGLLGAASFWIVLLAPIAASVGAATYRRRRDRLDGDVAYARTQAAKKNARRRLARARRLAGSNATEFHGAVAGALQGFLADKLNLSEAGFVQSEVDRKAQTAGVQEGTLKRLRRCLDECNRMQFAPASEAGDPKELLEEAAKLMQDIDRELLR